MRVLGLRPWWGATLVAVVLLASCESAADTTPDTTVPAGNAARFCALWPDARTTLLDTVSGNGSLELLEDETVDVSNLMRSHDQALESADAAAPAAIRAEWDTAYGAYTSVSDLLFTINYSGDVIHAAHLDLAFGTTGYDATATDVAAAVAAIDDWAVEACGDFCARWPEFEYILRYEENFDWGIWHDNVDRYLLTLDAGDRLVPDAVRDEWEVAVDIQRRRMTMFVDNNFSLDVDERIARAQWGVLPWDAAKPASDAALATIQQWTDTHCDAAVLTVGAPGTVAVRYTPQPELTGRTYLSVLLPAGVDFADVRGLDEYTAVWCSATGDYPEEVRLEDMPTEVLRPIEGQGEYFSSDLCNLIQHEERAVVAGGAHELFVGAFQGGPGAYGLYFAAPDYCLQIPIGVNGTTVVDVPPLEPCDLEPLGRDAEIARRTSPPDDADGRLWLELPSALGRDGYDFCRIDVYLLPAGTTLNAIGRGDAWPAGTVNVHTLSGRGASGGDRALADQPGKVPILAMPPSGTGEVMVVPSPRPGSSWDTRLADPVPLAAGAYDVWITEWCAVEGADSEDDWCAMTTVDVAGDTVVAMPELGECP